MYLLEVENLCKTYPSFSLQDVSFKIEEGYIMGFIGRNGAGKTTTLKSMLKFVKADKGKSIINGFDISTNEIDVKKSIGFVSGTDGFYQTTKIKTITNVTKKFFDNWNEELYRKLLSTFKLDENKKIKELSAGMKIKYQITLAMCHDAKLLILDEPTSGLDPVSRDELISALDRVSTMVNDRTSIVKFMFNNNKLLLKAETPNSGTSEDVIDCEYSGEDLAIAFNYKYVLDSIKTMDAKNVKVGLNGSLSATVFKPDSEEDYICLIMPIQIR